MLNKILIFGGHIQALGLARQTHELGLEVILCVEDMYCVARYSKYVDKVECYRSLDQLHSIVEKYYSTERHCLLFPTNDEMVEFLSVHYDEYSDGFCVGVPCPNIVSLFNDKRKAYQFAERNGISVPKCWYPNSMKDVRDMSTVLPYPVVVKPAIMYSFHQTFGKKAFRCNSKEELLSIYERIDKCRYNLKTVLIQEFLSGGPENLYSYATFAVDGESKISLIANRIRQNPMDFGNSTTFAVTCDVPEIKDSAERILRLSNYFGLGEVEFMYDAKSNTYKFLEINTRAWKWHTLSNQLGFSFISAMVHHFDGEEISPIVNFGKVGWVERLTDWTVSAKEIMKGKMSLTDFIKSYHIKKEYAVWSKNDIKPFFMYILLSPLLFIKRY